MRCRSARALGALCMAGGGQVPAHACTETPKPWYSACRPPRRHVLARQSVRPWKSLWVPFPRSAARRVRT